AQQIALMLLELRFEALEQREGVRCTACEAGQNLLVIQPPDLARGLLDYDVAERDLTVTAQRDRIAAPDRKDGGAVIGIHAFASRNDLGSMGPCLRDSSRPQHDWTPWSTGPIGARVSA